VRLIDVDAFRRLLVFRRTELAIALAACAAVLAFNILYGVLIAVGLSVADLLVRVARPHDALDAFGLTQKIGAELIFPTLPTALDAYQRWVATTDEPG
jgi:MFS superfamily sulfate permease-like transporter